MGLLQCAAKGKSELAKTRKQKPNVSPDDVGTAALLIYVQVPEPPAPPMDASWSGPLRFISGSKCDLFAMQRSCGVGGLDG